MLIKFSSQVMANGSGNAIDVGEWKSISSKVVTSMYICAYNFFSNNHFYRVMKAYLLLATMLSLARAHPARLYSGRLLTGPA